MEYETRVVNGVAAVIVPRGRLTMASAPELKALIERAVGAGRTLVVVDLGATAFMDSSGLGALISGLRSTRTAGGDLRIARPTEQVSMVLELTTVDLVLGPFGSVEEALIG
ncbi:STAS domain-containing protein [Antribacter sp. KLBMP9083]|uniref:Anti-sigma factor antagonist n=1 Tax=Antribacter soli TaxID=2910976 RepID=A0AA41U727_9MICO|nr:STAS domain-containing protein [Antribacter soli]MCF4121096.1 STAS domain-containing protein [Antribacter soli]